MHPQVSICNEKKKTTLVLVFVCFVCLFVGFLSIYFCISKTQCGSFSLIRNIMWAGLLLSCNHCNAVSFLTQSHPVWGAGMVLPTETKRLTEGSRPALLEHYTLQHTPCFQIVSRCFGNLNITFDHSHPYRTPPTPRRWKLSYKAAQQVPHKPFPRVYFLAQCHPNSFNT